MPDLSNHFDPELAPSREALFKSLRRRSIASERALQAMREVPREAFVDDDLRHLAYEDNALPTSFGQTISQPTIVAMMTTALDLQPDNAVLEIGTGSGYQAAVISRLANRCVTIELHEGLAERARAVLEHLGIDNVTVLTGDGSVGVPECAPYDRILVTAAAPSAPDVLLSQLRQAPGSRLVAPIGDQEYQALTTIDWTESGWKVQREGSVRFVPLRGEAGWSNTDWRMAE